MKDDGLVVAVGREEGMDPNLRRKEERKLLHLGTDWLGGSVSGGERCGVGLGPWWFWSAHRTSKRRCPADRDIYECQHFPQVAQCYPSLDSPFSSSFSCPCPVISTRSPCYTFLPSSFRGHQLVCPHLLPTCLPTSFSLCYSFFQSVPTKYPKVYLSAIHISN